MNNSHLRLECQRFVNFFKESVETNRYLDLSCHIYYGGESHPYYIAIRSKPNLFKTEKITETSQRYIQFITQDVEESLENRVQLLSTLDQTLQGYAVRIENSIKARWWYFILYLFGYQAKVPDSVKKVLDEVKWASDNLLGQRERERIRQEEVLREQTRRQELEELERNSCHLPVEIPNLSIRQEQREALNLAVQEAVSQISQSVASFIQSINILEDKNEITKFCQTVIESQLPRLERQILSNEIINTNPAESLLLKGKIIDQRITIREAAEKRIDYLDTHLTSEQKLMLTASEEKLKNLNEKLERIKTKWTVQLSETHTKYLEWLSNRDGFWLSPRQQLYMDISKEINELIKDVRGERFYQPYGQDHNIPEIQKISQELHKFCDKASTLLDNFNKQIRLNLLL